MPCVFLKALDSVAAAAAAVVVVVVVVAALGRRLPAAAAAAAATVPESRTTRAVPCASVLMKHFARAAARRPTPSLTPLV